MNLTGFDVPIQQKSIGYSADTEAVYEFFENQIGDTAFKTKPHQIPDTLTSIELIPGEKVIVVWLEYSIGDSFGWYVNRETYCVGLFRDIDSAGTLRQFIIGHNKNYLNGEESEFAVTTPDDQKFTLKSVPWYGEFDRLENVYISQVTITEGE